MHAKLLKTRFGILYSLVAAVVALPSTSSQVSAGEEAFIVLPGENRINLACPVKSPCRDRTEPTGPPNGNRTASLQSIALQEPLRFGPVLKERETGCAFLKRTLITRTPYSVD